MVNISLRSFTIVTCCERKKKLMEHQKWTVLSSSWKKTFSAAKSVEGFNFMWKSLRRSFPRCFVIEKKNQKNLLNFISLDLSISELLCSQPREV